MRVPQVCDFFSKVISAISAHSRRTPTFMLKTIWNSTLPNWLKDSRINYCISTFHLNVFLTHLGSMTFSSKLRSQTTMEAKRNAKNVWNSTLPNWLKDSRINYCISTFHLNVFLTHLGSMTFSSKLRSQTTMEAKRNARNVLKLNSSKLAQRF